MYNGYLTDVKGIKVGHAQSDQGITGCTVIICPEGAVAGVDVRGSAPGTRETDLLKPENLVDKIHGIALAGGSAYGLDCASGMMKYLEDNDIGFDVGVTKVPIVCGAVIFDLLIGDYTIRPDYDMGYEACKNASYDENRQGCIGGGTGATVGKILGANNAMKSGLGSVSINVGDLWVAALIITNSFGDVFDFESGKILAGVYDYKENRQLNTYNIMKKNKQLQGFSMKNTTIGVVATNAKLNKAQANKIAQMAHNGLARTINPIHTMFDGDTIFSIATGKVEADINLIGTMGAEAVAKAVNNSIKSACSCNDILSYKDINKKK
ncbi:P1 family peptidase [Abyssisolibacter fermentans]|uniref:P1 family peptidase n=1 Tax=Abyssisolibacter fermentans TaxID=1766203 RepID=UPI000830DA5C|nr:P1 family peptidase [Abyssisolibacter fermentans]